MSIPFNASPNRVIAGAIRGKVSEPINNPGADNNKAPPSIPILKANPGNTKAKFSKPL